MEDVSLLFNNTYTNVAGIAKAVAGIARTGVYLDLSIK
jgi:hypothetical protein